LIDVQHDLRTVDVVILAVRAGFDIVVYSLSSASYEALGQRAPSTSNCLIFRVTSDPRKLLWHSTSNGVACTVKQYTGL